MPKLKTHRGAAKRFKKTGSGKIKRDRSFASHLMSSKSSKRKRNLRKNLVVHKSDEKRINALIPFI